MKFRVELLARRLVFDGQHPMKVIDAADIDVQLVFFPAEDARHFVDGAESPVTKSDCPDLGKFADGKAYPRLRIGVINEQGVRAQRFHIFAYWQDGMNGPQRMKGSAGAAVLPRTCLHPNALGIKKSCFHSGHLFSSTAEITYRASFNAFLLSVVASIFALAP